MNRISDTLLTPDWPLQDKQGALSTTRVGGVSTAPYTSCNLGMHVGDDARLVEANRHQLEACLPAPPVWLNQVHGDNVITVTHVRQSRYIDTGDALYTRLKNQPLAIMTADCLPVLVADENGEEVAAIHGGWRGIANNLFANTLSCFKTSNDSLYAWLGPAIGPSAFQVGEDVRKAFLALGDEFNIAFSPDQENGKYLADIYLLARIRLERLGVTRVYGGGFCTYTDNRRFFSYRRDGVTGRMASLIWRK